MKINHLLLAVLIIGGQNIYAQDNNFFSNIFNNSQQEKENVRAFFGDKENNDVVIVDVNNMELLDTVETGHEITYTADKVANEDKVYVVNRGSNYIDVLTTDTMEITKSIELEHFPRSAEAMNANLALDEVSGMDKPMASIIDTQTDTLVLSVGKNEKVDKDNNPNFGGSHATGHPFWLDDNHFVLLDRYNRKVITYYIEENDDGEWETTKLNELDSTTSIHQIVPSKGNYLGEKGYFFGIAEGAKDTYPSVIKYKLEANVGLKQVKELQLKADGVDVNSMWLHHGDFHPSQKLMYVGSGDGTLFIIDYENMEIKKRLPAGKGAGHTKMVADKNLAIVINHKDVFVTIVDLETNEKIADLRVSGLDDKVGQTTIQAHPKYHVSSDSNYFYAFLTAEGKMYELDLEKLQVTRTVDVGGKPAQGSFVKVENERRSPFQGFGGGFFNR
jgi:WD40 repeat protein